MTIEIGPDGTPIVVKDDVVSSKETKNDVVKIDEPVKIEPIISKVPKPPIEEIKSDPANLTVLKDQATKSIESIKKLTLKESNTVVGSYQLDTERQLRNILKNHGMDSQQQEKAFNEIKVLLGW